MARCIKKHGLPASNEKPARLWNVIMQEPGNLIPPRQDAIKNPMYPSELPV
jgi:hypothetical protein